MIMTSRNRALYHEAIDGALRSLMKRAADRGSAWYYYSDGELIVGTRLALGGGIL